ncbi:MAG: MFS transporter [Deltaproteobacteria bacterium]|nr:MFS transporter [Deltaproteobacteria bacterium]
MRRLFASSNPSLNIMAIAFIIFGFARGVHSSFGVFYVALLQTFGWGRGITAAVFSVNLIVDAIASPIIGHLLDRYGPRNIVAGGCLLLCAGLWLSSRIQNLWEFYLYFGLVSAVGLSFLGMVPHVVLISEWFSTKRASALGTVSSGTGVGILLLAPVSEWLISEWGWARAFQILSAFALLLLLPLVWNFYRRGPYRQTSSGGSAAKEEWTARLAFASLQFWLIFISRLVAAGGTTVIITHQVAHVVDIGYSRLFAATVFGLMGVTSTGGRLVFGFLADRFSKQTAYTLNVLTTLVGVGALMAAHDASQTWLLYVYVLLFGIGFGSRAVILSALSADIFSGKRFGAIYGYSVISVGMGGALGSWLGGVFYDLTDSYFYSFALSAAGLALSDVCIWVASLERVSSYDKRLWNRGRKQ